MKQTNKQTNNGTNEKRSCCIETNSRVPVDHQIARVDTPDKNTHTDTQRGAART